jgi:hypothetical protein
VASAAIGGWLDGVDAALMTMSPVVASEPPPQPTPPGPTPPLPTPTPPTPGPQIPPAPGPDVPPMPEPGPPIDRL